MSKEVDAFFEHHGIKGMKWGVRHDYVPKVKSDHRVALEGNYIRKGASASAAEKKAANKIEVEKMLAVLGGVALVAAVAYAAHNGYAKQFTGVLLKAGSELKNVNALGDAQDFDRRLYTTFMKGDTNKYRGMFIGHLRKQGPTANFYETTLKATEDIRAPSQHQAAKLYQEFMKSAQNKVDLGGDYRSFNYGLVNDTPNNKRFYEFMKKKGYNAILDANDQFMSGYGAKKPLILFNAKSSTVKAGQNLVDLKLAKRLAIKQKTIIYSKQLSPVVALGAAYVAATTYEDRNEKRYVADTYRKTARGKNLTRSEAYAKVRSVNGTYKVVTKEVK